MSLTTTSLDAERPILVTYGRVNLSRAGAVRNPRVHLFGTDSEILRLVGINAALPPVSYPRRQRRLGMARDLLNAA